MKAVLLSLFITAAALAQPIFLQAEHPVAPHALR